MTCFLIYLNNASEKNLPANIIINIISLSKNIAIDAADLTECVPINYDLTSRFFSPISVAAVLNSLRIISWVILHKLSS